MPERRLWASVVALLIVDAKAIIRKMQVQMEMHGCVSSDLNSNLKQLYTCIESAWMHQVCEWAECHADHVYRHIQKYEKECGVQGRYVVPRAQFDELLGRKNFKV